MDVGVSGLRVLTVEFSSRYKIRRGPAGWIDYTILLCRMLIGLTTRVKNLSQKKRKSIQVSKKPAKSEI